MSEHSCRIDYFGYTIKSKDLAEIIIAQDTASLWHDSIRQLCPKYLLKWIDEWDWKVPSRKNGYAFGFNIDNAIFCWFNGRDIHIEITGDGCTLLYNSGDLLEIVRDNANNATRIDIAHDIVTDTTPTEFIAYSLPFLAHSEDISKTGETQYIGSLKSDRYCKVYRYNAPHPRADRLRIEYTYKTKNAAYVCNLLKTSSEAVIALSSGARYGWGHICYKTPQNGELIEIKAHRKDRNTAKTVIWYKTQVLPAIKKMLKSGDYTLDEILKDLENLQ